MDTLTIRETTADLPVLDSDELTTTVSMLQPDDGHLSLFNYTGKDLRALELTNVRLYDGRISEVSAERVDLDRVHMSSVELTGCDLATLTLRNSKLSRVRFANCRLLGARFEDLVLEDVVFQDCKLDYAMLTNVTAKGPVVFIGCSLIETELDGCDLSGVAFEDCILRATSFQSGTYRGTDLRGERPVGDQRRNQPQTGHHRPIPAHRSVAGPCRRARHHPRRRVTRPVRTKRSPTVPDS